MNQWLQWAKRIRAISQTGKAYSEDPFDLERYSELDTMAQAMIANISNLSVEEIANLYVDESGYPTPKMDVRAGVFKDDKILLIRETADGLWSLPGGWIDEHDAPKNSIVREVREESGFEVSVQKLVALIDRDAHGYAPKHLHRIYKLHFLCELTGGKPTTSIETSEVGFFELTELPELSLGRVLPQDITLLWEHAQNLSLPTYFD